MEVFSTQQDANLNVASIDESLKLNCPHEGKVTPLYY